jgi:ABC-type bacteriocin/lantibiotic exporter with double-glycine peptidase domain
MSSRLRLFSVIKTTATPSVVAALLASSAAISLLSFAVPLTVLQAYDRIIAYNAVPTLIWLSIGCLSALILNAFLEFCRSSLSAWVAARFVRKKDVELMDAILHADPGTIAAEGVERHLSRFRSLSSTGNALIVKTLPVAAEAPFAVAYFAVLVFVGGSTAVVAGIAVLAEMLLSVFARTAILGAARRAEDAEKERIFYLSYALERIHFIKAQALEHIVLKGFEQTQSAELETSSRRAVINRRLDEFGRIILSGTTFGTIIWGGVLVSRGQLTIGSVSASLFFATRLAGVARDVRRASFAVADAQMELEDLEAGVSLPARRGGREPALPRSIDGRLEFDSVVYRGQQAEHPLIANLSFVVRPGATVSIAEAPLSHGFNRGAVLCRLAAGLLPPDSGQVLVDAYPSGKWDFIGKGGAVAYVSSRGSVLPGSILENVSCFEPGRREAALDAARLFGLDAVVSRLPRGFETEIGPRNPGGLSASALRLITVARAFSVRPRILIWDRADADMDDESRKLTLSLLSELRGSTTMLINSDDPSFRALGDQEIAEAGSS